MQKNIKVGKTKLNLFLIFLILINIPNLCNADYLEGNFTEIKVLDKISSKNISIKIENGKVAELSKENKSIIYRCFNYSKRKKLTELDSAIKLFSINQIIDGKETKDKREETLSCKVCFDRPITIVCIPCGHLFCNSCIKTSKHCHICRQSIKLKQKVYI